MTSEQTEHADTAERVGVVAISGCQKSTSDHILFFLRRSSSAMISVDNSIPLESGTVAEFLTSTFSSHHLLPDFLGEFVTTHASVAVLCLAVILFVRYLRSPWRSVPPGPQGLPIIGNVLEVRDKAWLFKEDCQKRYSGPFPPADVVIKLTILQRKWST